MSDPTQASPEEHPTDALTPAPAAGEAAAPERPGPPFDAEGLRRGLLIWLGIVAAGGAAAALLGHPEGGALFAGAGVFALAQASDGAATLEHYRRFVDSGIPQESALGRLVRWVAASLVPLAGAGFYVAIGLFAWRGGDSPFTFAALWCACAALVCLALIGRPFADALALLLFRATPGRTRRLVARIVVIALLLPPPARQLMPTLLDAAAQGGTSLADAPGLVAQLLGEVAIAFAGVGLFVRRDWAATRERLGLTGMRPAYWLVALAGFAGAIALNGGSGWIEEHVFPALFKQDSDMTSLIAGHMPLATSLLLGLSAGTGEEVMMRGALQPRLGIPLSALLFASAHVQYTWFGMMTVGLLGVLLGVIRARTNTTTAIVVHGAYDIYAALTST